MSSRRKQFKPKSSTIDALDRGDETETNKMNQSLNVSSSMLIEHSDIDLNNERKRKRSTSDADADEEDDDSESSQLNNDTMNDIDDIDEVDYERLNQTAGNAYDPIDQSEYSQLNSSVMLLMFKCKVCGKGFKHRRSLNRHVKLHSGEKNFKCPFCTTAFARSDHLKAHIRTHNNSKPYRCSICQCGYSTQAALKVHIAHHHSKSKFKCVLCNDLEFHSQLALEGHMYTNHSKENETADLNELINETATMNPTLVSVDESAQQRTKLTDINNLIKNEDYCFNDGKVVESSSGEIASINVTISPIKTTNKTKQTYCDTCNVRFSNIDSYSSHMKSCHNHKMIQDQDSSVDVLNYSVETQYQCSQCSLSLFKLNDYLQHIKREHCVEVYRCVLCKQMQLFDNVNLLKEHFFQVHQSSKVDTYKCRLCSHVSLSLDDLDKHLKSVHNQSTQANLMFKCQHCDMQFGQSSSLNQHIQLNHSSTTYSCQYCRNTFNSKAQLERHVRIHLSSIDLKCNICDKQFDNEAHLSQHKLSSHSLVKVTCSYCTQAIENESHFKEHFKRHNNIGQPNQPAAQAGKMAYNCVVCRQQLTSNNEYLTHMKNHLALSKKIDLDVRKESANSVCPLSPATTASSSSSTTSSSHKTDVFLCEICSSKFDSNFKLQTHLLLKHEYGNQMNATYSCPVCDEAYNRADLLLQHTQIHGSAAKIYKCSQCSMAFVFKSQLINHSFSHQTKNLSTSILHQQLSQPLAKMDSSSNQGQYVVNTNANGSKTFTCLTCSKTFANQRNLNVHMRIHTGFRPFECDICNRKFTRRENLRSHMKCHLNLRPFTCSICNRSFRRKSHVSSHIEVHFKSKVHNCIECDKQFDQLSSFLTHLIGEHNIYDKELLLLIKSKQIVDLAEFSNLDYDYVVSQPSGSPASMSLSAKPCAQQSVAHNAIPPLQHYQNLKSMVSQSLLSDTNKYYDEDETSPYNDEDESTGLVIEDGDYVEDEMPAEYVNSVNNMNGENGSDLEANYAEECSDQVYNENGDIENDDYDFDQSIDYTD